MVDTETYNLMHISEDVNHDRTELSGDEMRAAKPPAEPFILLLPATIRGYGFHNKKWSKHISVRQYITMLMLLKICCL